MPIKVLVRLHDGVRGHRSPVKRVGDVAFQTFCLPPPENGSWDLDSILKDPDSLIDLSNLLKDLGTRRVFALRVSDASGKVIPQKEFTTKSFESEGVEYFTDPTRSLDGISLDIIGDTFIMAGAGCHLFTAVSGNSLIPAHGAFRSLYSRDEFLEFIETGKIRETQGGIISSLATTLCSTGRTIQLANVFGSYGTRSPGLQYHFEKVPEAYHLPRFFKRKGWGEAATLVEDSSVYVNSDVLASIQCKQAGFRSYTSEYSIGLNETYAHTRHANPNLRNRRNMVIIIRRP